MIKRNLARAIGIGLNLSAATVSSAAAQEAGGWYFGAFAGQSQVDANKEELDYAAFGALIDAGLTVSNPSSSLDDSDTAWSMFAGYRLSPYFSVELGYQDLGGAAYSASGLVGIPGFPDTFPASLNLDLESSGFTLAGIGSLPLGESFDLHARLGLYFADTEITVGRSTLDMGFSESFSGSSQEVFYGIGAAFHFGGNWTLGLDYQLFKDVGDEDETGEGDIDVLSLALSSRL